MIPFLDLKKAYNELQVELDKEILNVLSSGLYIGGRVVEHFEYEYASYCGVEHCISVANGLDALTLSLRALEIGIGDEVIVPSNTFIATWLAVSHCGATIVPVEPDINTGNIEINNLKNALTNKTRAIILVHLYGLPVDLDPILNLARERSIYVVEDAAQAHGSIYKGKKIGGHGDIVAWSFYPGKNLGAFGDAGAVTTQSFEIAQKIRLLRNYGSEQKYIHNILGFNSRLDPIQATVLSIKLKYLDEWNKRRSAIAKRYLVNLANSRLILPNSPGWAEHAWHLFVVRTENRKKLSDDLLKYGINTQIHYPIPPYRQEAYRTYFNSEAYPTTNLLASQILSLPIGPHLMMEEVDYISEVIIRNT